jgi:hypothetical protein
MLINYRPRTEIVQSQPESQRMVTVNDCQLQTENSSIPNTDHSIEIQDLYTRLSAIEEVLIEKDSEILQMRELNESIIRQHKTPTLVVPTEVEGIIKDELNMFNNSEANQKSIGKCRV